MQLGFVIPLVGSAVSDAPALSAFVRGLEDLGYDTLWVGDRLVTPVDLGNGYRDRPAPAATVSGQDEGAGRLWSIARRAAEEAGRDPDALKTAMRINLDPGTSVDSVADQLKRYAESGVDEAYFDAFTMFAGLDQLLDFAAQVIERTGRL
ncbi:hypothetical protein AB0890_09895 [Streptomyces sp. NPDC005406]|uniref:hypothetical protein n=1 Tax=Streptomyces sp. NPDC005406 TaxID=3155339 RepID=UPI00345111D4